MGAITSHIDRARDLTIRTVEGPVKADDVRRAVQDYYAGGQATFNILWDLTRADFSGVEPAEIAGLARSVRLYSGPRRGRTALVVASELGFGLSRMYGIHQDIGESEVDHQVFRDLDSALAWLGEDSG